MKDILARATGLKVRNLGKREYTVVSSPQRGYRKRTGMGSFNPYTKYDFFEKLQPIARYYRQLKADRNRVVSFDISETYRGHYCIG